MLPPPAASDATVLEPKIAQGWAAAGDEAALATAAGRSFTLAQARDAALRLVGQLAGEITTD